MPVLLAVGRLGQIEIDTMGIPKSSRIYYVVAKYLLSM